MQECKTMSRFLIFLTLLSVLVPKAAFCDPQVPCFFIFGDSGADAGNNNGFQTEAKANYPPYGVDFLGHRATGRFTKGKTIVDFLALRLGLKKLIPPYLGATLSDLRQGVNYASGAAGIRNDTGRAQGEILSLGQQISHHNITVTQLSYLLGDRTAALKHLSKCLYTFQIGSNDYLNNYFMPETYPDSANYSPAEFAKVHVEDYATLLKILHKNGARKVALFGLGFIGMTPYTLNSAGLNKSVEMNAAAELFNVELKSMVHELNANLPDAKFTFLNTTGITYTPTVEIDLLKKTCCKVQNNFTCIPGAKNVCDDRSKVIFFDNVHTTEIFNKPIADRYYSAQTETDAIPYDIQSLA